MSELEELLMAILVFAYGVTCYIAGKGNLLDLVVLMLHDMANELKEKLEEENDK